MAGGAIRCRPSGSSSRAPTPDEFQFPGARPRLWLRLPPIAVHTKSAAWSLRSCTVASLGKWNAVVEDRRAKRPSRIPGDAVALRRDPQEIGVHLAVVVVGQRVTCYVRGR
jgi:hypothetical protein